MQINNFENKKKRILGIDFGSKRVGVAVSDPERKFAMPLSVVSNTPVLISSIRKIAEDHEVTTIVVGESRDYKGEANPILFDTLKFKKALEEIGFNVVLELEFMTSIQAERLQGKNEMTDASAAALILQSYLDRNRTD